MLLLNHGRLRGWLAAALLMLLLLPQARGSEFTPVLLRMIRDTSVHQELQLREDQKEQVFTALRPIDERWFRARIMPSEPRSVEEQQLTEELRAKLDVILDDGQTQRLTELERQALGTRMLVRDDVATELDLDATQRASLAQLFLKTDEDAARLQEAQGKSGASAALNQQLEQLRQNERQQILSQLSSEQQSAIGSLTGTPFNFSSVKRTYPLAPELTDSGVEWVQGGPVKLDDLRGKVVAVHFYAFQCINCQRNLPHYQAWYEDFSPEDFVIIGIQSPELPAEREFVRVKGAAKMNGMKYPIMLDGGMSNWNAWSNRMWPSVYLIDKQGFLRQWWHGELNWQGNPGEQKMRRVIEQLIAETD